MIIGCVDNLTLIVIAQQPQDVEEYTDETISAINA